MSKSLEERMRELEEGYNKMSDTISPEKIIHNVEKTSRKKTSWRTIYMFGGGTLAAGIAALLFLSQPGVAPNNEDTAMTGEDTEEEQTTEEDISLSKEDAEALMNDYKESFVTLVNEAGEDQKIDSYQSKDEVQEHFQNVMSEDLAAWMTDSYFTEKEDGVYVIAKDGPTWLEEEQLFELEEVSEAHVKIIQERNNELLGHVEMVYHAKYQDNRWMVAEIESNEVGGSEEPSEGSVMDTANKVVDMLARQDMKRVAEYVHPEKGLLFSPYIHIEEDAQIFQKEEAANFFSPDSKVYEWGTYDGRGNTISLTPAEYYEEFIYDKNFKEADEVNVDEQKQRGNMKSNIKEVFPNATIVEFYVEGSEEDYEGIDWSSLNLVFEQHDNEWKLVAIVHDQWTI